MGWERHETDDGKAYYHNKETGVTRWDTPEDHTAAPKTMQLGAPGAPSLEELKRRRAQRMAESSSEESEEEEDKTPASAPPPAFAERPASEPPKEEPEPEPQEPLPEGWVEHKHPTSGKSYFHNASTGITQYTRPVVGIEVVIETQEPTVALAPTPLPTVAIPVPAGWTEHIHPSTKQTYYANQYTGETTYEQPTAPAQPAQQAYAQAAYAQQQQQAAYPGYQQQGSGYPQQQSMAYAQQQQAYAQQQQQQAAGCGLGVPSFAAKSPLGQGQPAGQQQRRVSTATSDINAVARLVEQAAQQQDETLRAKEEEEEKKRKAKEEEEQQIAERKAQKQKEERTRMQRLEQAALQRKERAETFQKASFLEEEGKASSRLVAVVEALEQRLSETERRLDESDANAAQLQTRTEHLQEELDLVRKQSGSTTSQSGPTGDMEDLKRRLGEAIEWQHKTGEFQNKLYTELMQLKQSGGGEGTSNLQLEEDVAALGENAKETIDQLVEHHEALERLETLMGSVHGGGDTARAKRAEQQAEDAENAARAVGRRVDDLAHRLDDVAQVARKAGTDATGAETTAQAAQESMIESSQAIRRDMDQRLRGVESRFDTIVDDLGKTVEASALMGLRQDMEARLDALDAARSVDVESMQGLRQEIKEQGQGFGLRMDAVEQVGVDREKAHEAVHQATTTSISDLLLEMDKIRLEISEQVGTLQGDLDRKDRATTSLRQEFESSLSNVESTMQRKIYDLMNAQPVAAPQEQIGSPRGSDQQLARSVRLLIAGREDVDRAIADVKTKTQHALGELEESLNRRLADQKKAMSALERDMKKRAVPATPRNKEWRDLRAMISAIEQRLNAREMVTQGGTAEDMEARLSKWMQEQTTESSGVEDLRSDLERLETKFGKRQHWIEEVEERVRKALQQGESATKGTSALHEELENMQRSLRRQKREMEERWAELPQVEPTPAPAPVQVQLEPVDVQHVVREEVASVLRDVVRAGGLPHLQNMAARAMVEREDIVARKVVDEFREETHKAFHESAARTANALSVLAQKHVVLDEHTRQALIQVHARLDTLQQDTLQTREDTAKLFRMRDKAMEEQRKSVTEDIERVSGHMESRLREAALRLRQGTSGTVAIGEQRIAQVAELTAAIQSKQQMDHAQLRQWVKGVSSELLRRQERALERIKELESGRSSDAHVVTQQDTAARKARRQLDATMIETKKEMAQFRAALTQHQQWDDKVERWSRDMVDLFAQVEALKNQPQRDHQSSDWIAIERRLMALERVYPMSSVPLDKKEARLPQKVIQEIQQELHEVDARIKETEQITTEWKHPVSTLSQQMQAMHIALDHSLKEWSEVRQRVASLEGRVRGHGTSSVFRSRAPSPFAPGPIHALSNQLLRQ